MTKRRDLLIGLAAAPIVLPAQTRAAAAETADFLFVQSARHLRYANGKLSLVDVSPMTVVFSDRPERLAGHMLTENFVPFWSEGENSFEDDPPNANLSVLEEGVVDNIVLTLHNPKLEGQDLTYRVDLLEGGPPETSGPASLFIDIIGRPITPVSFAGARRRMWRRAIY